MQIAAEITVQCGDILKASCDVIALKYAQAFHGADAAVFRRLRDLGVESNALCPEDGSYVLVRSGGAVEAKDILFVGLPSIDSFSYQDIRRLGATVLSTLKKERPRATSLAMTIHGVGFGLDEIECVQQQLLGYADSFERGDFPGSLTKIVIIERDTNRVQAIDQIVSEFHVPRGAPAPATRIDSGYSFESTPAGPDTPVKSSPRGEGKDFRCNAVLEGHA